MCFDTTVPLKEMGYYVDYVIGTMPGYLLRMQNVFLFKSCRKCMLYCIFSLSLSLSLDRKSCTRLFNIHNIYTCIVMKYNAQFLIRYCFPLPMFVNLHNLSNCVKIQCINL